MAYDLHIEESIKKARRNYPDYQIFDELHDLMFSSKRSWLGKVVLIHRMQDYYKDSQYSLSELPGLMEEMEFILENEKAPRIIEMATRIKELCDKALEKKANIYGFAD